VCCDGTWNQPDEVRDRIAAPTNVAKFALGVDCSDKNAQRLFYEPGVGTTPGERVMGGAFGYGLSRNICACYRWLAQNFSPGDQLSLFGFSRGAYTARSLAGLIHNCGILSPEHVDQVDQAFAFYRDRTSQTHPRALAAQIFRTMYSQDNDEIHFIGVWDTVGALGIPTHMDLPGWDWVMEHFKEWEELWGFHDTQLSSSVKFAYHALAIDELREPFQPTLWTSGGTGGQTLEQVWFSGAHTDVGGGSKDPSLSDIALLWMAAKARACGVTFKSGLLENGGPDGDTGRVAPNWSGPITESKHGIWNALHTYHRLKQPSVRAAPAQTVASSAARRFTAGQGYSPEGLDWYLGVKDEPRVTQVVDEPAPAGPGT
jgi:uncharacterized protein (DUF2235 family)